VVDESPGQSILFDVMTPLGFRVRTTLHHWTVITTLKHPVLHGREDDLQAVLRSPDAVRRSKHDPAVFLFYRVDGRKRWLCAVTRRLNGDGFLVTAYRTENIKEGDPLWP
jgi:hypothetical protein